MAENIYQNFYAPPAAVLVRYPKGRLRILEFPRFSTWGVLGLSVLTLYVYVFYWLYTRTQILNAVMPERRIVPAFYWTVIVMNVCDLALAFLEPYFVNVGDVVLFQQLLAVAANIGLLIWVFKFRNRLNILSEANYGDGSWAGAGLTFFFSVFYLSYKVNELIDLEKTMNVTNEGMEGAQG